MTWQLSADRFLSLWFAAGSDEFPFPLRYRTTARWEDEHDARMHAADTWRRQLTDPGLDRAIGVLRSGQVAVEVYGMCGGTDLRVRAAVDPAIGVIARQHSDDDIRLAAVRADASARAVVDHIPDAPPGRAPERAAATQELTNPTVTGPVRVRIADDGPQALRRLLMRDRSASGSIRILFGNERGGYSPASEFGWIDVAGDGRYLIESGAYTTVTPASNTRLCSELLRRIESARRRRHDAADLSSRRIHGLGH